VNFYVVVRRSETPEDAMRRILAVSIVAVLTGTAAWFVPALLGSSRTIELGSIAPLELLIPDSHFLPSSDLYDAH
jgi:hypothetical protein